MDNYIMSIRGNKIQIIKPDVNYYQVVYEKEITNPKKDLLEAYLTYQKLNKGE